MMKQSQLERRQCLRHSASKNEQIAPDFMTDADIVSIYKGKGERSSLDNER